MAINVLFQGVTIAPARDFISSVLARGDYDRIVLPCVGRWAAASAIARAQVDPTKLWCSDLSLFSSVVGTIIDPELSLDDLGLTLDPIAQFVDGAETPEELAAGVLVGLRWLQLPPKNLYMTSLRAELVANAGQYRDHVAGKLAQIGDLLGGAHYAVRDVRSVLLELEGEDETTGAYVNLPGYAGGYTRQYGDAEGTLGWAPGAPEYDPKELLLGSVTTEALVLGYVHHGRGGAPPDWLPVYAFDAGKGRTDYIVANHDTDEHRARSRSRAAGGTLRRFPIYDENEITAESVVQFVQVTRATALYYRDLFVHRLGSTEAERYAVMLIDGRITTAMGLYVGDVLRGADEHLSETFGISVSSKRYARLGKLFMLCLTSGQMREWLHRTNPALSLHELRGIKTTSVTQHHEGKTDRSVMKLASRERLPTGQFRLVYKGDFRDDTWADCVEQWVERWGARTR